MLKYYKNVQMETAFFCKDAMELDNGKQRVPGCFLQKEKRGATGYMKNIKNTDFYSQYIGVIRNVRSLQYFSKYLIELGVKTNIYIQDISDQSYEKKCVELGKIILAERMRGVFEKSDPTFYNLIRVGESDYVLIISISRGYEEENKEKVKKILHTLFYISHAADVNENIRKVQSADKTRKEFLEHLGGALTDGSCARAARRSEKKEIARFQVEEALSEEIREFLETNEMNAEALLNMALAKTLCVCLNSRKLLLNRIQDQNIMMGGPLLYEEDLEFGERFRSIKKQLYWQEKSPVKVEALYREKEDEILACLFVSTYFSYSHRYHNLLRSISEDKVYRIPAIQTFDTPLFVQCSFEEGSLVMTYIYDRAGMQDADMENLHLNFSSVLDVFFRKRQDVEVLRLHGIAAVEASMKREKLITAWMQNQEVFQKVPMELIEELYQTSALSYPAYFQVIMTKGTPLQRVFFLVKGKMGVMGNSPDGYANPLYMLKKGEMFGIEAVLEGAVSPVHYRAQSNDVVILSFDRDVFWEICQKQPQVYECLLKIQSERLHRMEKLWLGA